MASSLSASGMAVGLITVARSMDTLFCNIGVMTMKMISSTSITSTMGVTLMLELTLLPSLRTATHIIGTPYVRILTRMRSGVAATMQPARGLKRRAEKLRQFRPADHARPGRPFTPCLALVALLDEVVHQLARGVIHLHVKGLNAPGEVVKRHNGGDGHEESESRGHQGFRNTTGDSADTRNLLGSNLVKRVQNADNGAKQADERRRSA